MFLSKYLALPSPVPLGFDFCKATKYTYILCLNIAYAYLIGTGIVIMHISGDFKKVQAAAVQRW